MKKYVPKEEFRRRLVRLHHKIERVLLGECNPHSLFTYIAFVISYLWCNMNVNSYFKEVDDK